MIPKVTGWMDVKRAAEHFVSFLNDTHKISREEWSGRVKSVIGVMGSAGLGKTAFCYEVAQNLNSNTPIASHVKLDGYLLDRKTRWVKGVNGYELDGWRYEYADSQLQAIICKGELMQIPTYLPTGTYGEPVTIEPRPIVILDGNYSYLGKIRKLLSVLIYFKSDLETMRALRIERDVVLEKRFPFEEAERVWDRELISLRRHILVAEKHADIRIEVNRERLLRFWQ